MSRLFNTKLLSQTVNAFPSVHSVSKKCLYMKRICSSLIKLTKMQKRIYRNALVMIPITADSIPCSKRQAITAENKAIGGCVDILAIVLVKLEFLRVAVCVFRIIA